MASVEEKFTAAVQAIKKLPKDGPFQPSYDMMKKFYGLFKQATEGPCNEPRPAFWNAIKKVKWEAWSCLGDMSKVNAQEEYVTEMLKIMVINFKAKDVNHMVQIIEAMPQTEEVINFLRIIGPFFEVVTMKEYEKTLNGGMLNGDVIHIPNDNDNGSIDGELPQIESKGHGADTEINKDGASDTSHPIYVNEDQSHDSADGDASSSSGTEDEFCDSMDQDISMERKVRFADTEPLQVVGENQPLTSTPMVADRITTEAEIYSIPGSQPIQRMNHSDISVQRRTISKTPVRDPAGGTRERHQIPLSRTSSSSEEMSEHIALVLERLQRDMNSVLVRLNSLETMAVTRHKDQDSESARQVENKNTWWLFSKLDMKTVFFILVWPFVVNRVIKFLSRRQWRFPRK